jgi:hypothetical protein
MRKYVMNMFIFSYRMTYKYDEKSALDLPAYFQKYKNELPKLAIITEGVYGKTTFDDFPADQV